MAIIDTFSYDDIGAIADVLKIGWTNHDNGGWHAAGSGAGPNAPRTGLNYIGFNTGGLGSDLWRTGGGTGDTYYEYGGIATGIAWDNTLSTEYFLGFMESLANDYHLTLKLNGTGQIEVRRGTGTVLATSDFPGGLQNDVWYWMSFIFRIHDTLGTIWMQINGVNVVHTAGAAMTGLDTRNGMTEGKFNQVSHGRIYLDDTHFLGGTSAETHLADGTKVYVKFPVNEGFHNGSFTPFSGTDETDMIDEIGTPTASSDNISSSTVNHKSTATISALGVTGTVNSVQITTHAQKDVSGEVRGFKNIIRSGGSDFQGALEIFPSPGTLIARKDIWLQNPNGPVAWTVASVDAHEPGVQVTT